MLTNIFVLVREDNLEYYGTYGSLEAAIQAQKRFRVPVNILREEVPVTVEKYLEFVEPVSYNNRNYEHQTS